MAVLRLQAKGSVEKSVTEALDDYLNARVFATGAYDLVNRDRIDEVMKEFRLQKSGVCETTKCYADMGGAMGAEKLLAGSISLLGETYIITLKVIDITEIREESVASEECRCSLNDLAAKVRGIVEQVIAPPPPPAGTGPAVGAATTRQEVPEKVVGRASGGEKTKSGTPTGSPMPGSGAEITGKDGAPMVLVAAGEFLMGSRPKDPGWRQDEEPQHRVTLDTYFIDKYEVTVGRYRLFLQAVKRDGHLWCEAGEKTDHDHEPRIYFEQGGERTTRSVLSDPRWSGSEQPIVAASWYDAYAYCAWAGKRLPTEAEWEKAARGTKGQVYPWGDDYDGKAANGASSIGKTVEVGSYPRGASPYGALDMAGNAAEWVQDHYDSEYYATSPSKNPTASSSQYGRVVRGGSWGDAPAELRAANRNAWDPGFGTTLGGPTTIGFRCARDRDVH